MNHITPTDQLRLPFDHGGDKSKGICWLMVERPGHARRLVSWLSNTGRSVSKPYLVELADGRSRLGSNDLVVVAAPGTDSGVLFAPRHFCDEDVEGFRASWASSMETAVLEGSNARIVDAALVRFSGGARPSESNESWRSSLERDLDRLSVTPFRNNPATVRKVTARALGRPGLSVFLQGVFHRARADAMSEEGFSERDRPVSSQDLADEYLSASNAFLSVGYERAARAAARLSARHAAEASAQFDLFDGPESERRPRNRAGLCALACSALPLMFETSNPVFDRRASTRPCGLDLVRSGEINFDGSRLRAWLLDTSADTIVPNVRIQRPARGSAAPLSIMVALTSEMAAMMSVMPDARAPGPPRRGDWLAVPHISERAVVPATAQIGQNEVVYFEAERGRGGKRDRLALTLLTPAGETANILLPHTL